MKAITKIKYTNSIIFTVLLLVNFLANFTGLIHFGLYEDDYWYVANPANLSIHELLAFLGENISDLEMGEGRLIGMNLPLLIVHFLFNAGGLSMLYVTGLVLITVNAYLIFTLIRKSYNPLLGMLMAVLFLVFPADTSRPFLTHIYQLQLSMTFVLIGFHLFASKRYLLSYLFAFFSLLTYENAFLPFMLAPFVVFPKWNRKVYLQGLYNAIICGILIISIFVFRKLTGESRVAELVMTDFIKKTLASTIIGPVTVLYSYVASSVQSILQVKDYLLNSIIALIVLFSAFWLLFKNFAHSHKIEEYKINLKQLKSSVEITEELRQFLQLLIVSSALLAISYLFSYTHYPPTVLKSRMTSVHFAASIGGSLFMANLLYYLIYLVKRNRTMAWILLSVFFALLVKYSAQIQRDYKIAWKNQQLFWQDVIKRCPDVTNNTIILVANKDLDSTEYIITHSWPMPKIFEHLYDFPAQWDHPPKVMQFHSWDEFKYDTVRNSLYFIPAYPFLFEERDTVFLENSNVIYLQKNNNALERQYDTLFIENKPLYLKPLEGNTLKDFTLDNIGKLMMDINN